MKAVKFRSFQSELLELYTPPLRARATLVKMRQVLEETASLPGVRTTYDLTPQTVARFITQHPDRSVTTTVGLLSYLRAACSYAVVRAYLAASPFAARKVWIRAERPQRKRHHSREEIARVLDHLGLERATWAGGRLHALAALVAYTGVRRNEALYAQVADFDLAGGVFRIEPRRRLKTSAASCPIPLPDELVEVLAEWLPRTGSVWAFPGARKAKPWTGGLPGYKPLDRLKAAGERAGVAGFTFQSLRHSWATHAESLWGLPDTTIQRVLRHTSPRTQWHYRHADLVNLRNQVHTLSFAEHRERAQALRSDATQTGEPRTGGAAG